MRSDRLQRQIERLLDQCEEAISRREWAAARELATAVLAVDPENADALGYCAMADRSLGSEPLTTMGVPVASPPTGDAPNSLPPSFPTGAPAAPIAAPSPAPPPSSFGDGRYTVQKLLGEGGKKLVYLAHDGMLDRDVAFALIKTDGLDAIGRQRVQREAQAMGRLGSHPHIVSVFDLGDHDGQPYMVTELMGGGAVEGLLENAPDHRLPLDHALRIADQVCQGLEFADEHHLVHRDLKPGNVWLTTSGIAKIGDFGLAVATDRSRLTQAGMMVGTVSYMPPEQALGGEVTPRSDLYSLGAMLYEMVCGRPPFIGDESVAIITQHLNTPPIAPSWHNPAVPPGLETLILRLLAKDAAKRPASASEVRQALAALALQATGERAPTAGDSNGPHPEPGSVANPLYQRTFVGREAELQQLQSAFDRALSGQGSLVMVVGEPGIGKTALCEQIATYVAMRGGKTLVGHCYEEGSLSLPYLPFIEALRTYVLERDPEGLKHDLGSGAGEVARIVSEVRDRMAVELRPASADPDEDRWRLYQALTGFLRNASSVQPLLVILEDLHWADRGTLDLLQHLARQLSGARLLLVGNYRDVEVDRTHPLSGVLADLRRNADFQRIPLRGLTTDEVQRMLSTIAGQPVSWSLAEAVHRQTEGNPLFVQEVLRYLAEEGLVQREDGHWQRTGALEEHIPEGLRDVVGKRLSRLSESANRVLAIAAVVGREFRLDVLQQVAGLPEEELYRALEEASDRAVVESRSTPGAVGFRFTHAFFRQTLYEEIFVPRRIRLHQQVGKAMEEVYGRRLEEHAAELAEHFAQSTEPGDLAKALRYSELAAQRSMQVFAYGETVRHLEQALRTQEVLDPDDWAKHCDLLLALGDAMLPLEEPRRVADTVAEEAFALAEARHDSARAARAAIQACEAILRAGHNETGRPPPGTAEFRLWAERADQQAAPDSIERIYADAYLGLARVWALGPASGHVHLRAAAERALASSDDTASFAAAGSAALRSLLALRDYDLRGRVAAAVRRRSGAGARRRDLAEAVCFAGETLLDRGDRDGAEALWGQLGRLAEQTRDTTTELVAMGTQVRLAYLDGRLDESLRLIDQITDRTQRLGMTGWGPDLPPVSAARLHHDRGHPVEPFLELVAAPQRPPQAQRAVILSWLGRVDEVHTILARFESVGAEDDESGIQVLVWLFEASIGIGDAEMAAALIRRLAPRAGDLFIVRSGVSIGRLLGDAARLLEQPAEARD